MENDYVWSTQVCKLEGMGVLRDKLKWTTKVGYSKLVCPYK